MTNYTLSNFVVQVAGRKTNSSTGESFLLWKNDKDDTVGAGSYGTQKAAEAHKKKFLKLWGRYAEKKITDLRQTLRDEYKFLSTNDSRLHRATNAIENFGGIRIVTFTMPTVVDCVIREEK